VSVSAQADGVSCIAVGGEIPQEMHIPTPCAVPGSVHEQKRRGVFQSGGLAADDFKRHAALHFY
jgi:hypothetical protein